jgi:hypothetical protein
MPLLLERMDETQLWVLGTPVYWWGPTAQFKAFVDRWYGGVYTKTVNFIGQRVILTVPMEDTDLAGARHLIGMLTDSLNYLEAEIISTILAPGVLDRGVVREHPDVLERAYRAGWEAVKGNGKQE